MEDDVHSCGEEIEVRGEPQVEQGEKPPTIIYRELLEWGGYGGDVSDDDDADKSH